MAIVTGSAIAAVLMMETPALADCHHSNYISGTERITTGPNGSWGYAGWNSQKPKLTLQTQGARMTGGRCMVAAFDWATLGGHYDARMVRDCDNGTGFMSDNVTEKSSALVGLQKWGTCYDIPQQYHSANCRVSGKSYPGCGSLDGMNFVLSSNNKTTRWWSRSYSGVLSFSSGGDAYSPTK